MLVLKCRRSVRNEKLCLVLGMAEDGPMLLLNLLWLRTNLTRAGVGSTVWAIIRSSFLNSLLLGMKLMSIEKVLMFKARVAD